MTALQDWKKYFEHFGVAWQSIPGNTNVIQLTNIAGCPLFRGVNSTVELNELHTKARTKSKDMQRLLVLGLPFDHVQGSVSLPGNITLPKLRVYGGNVGDTFSLSGHQIESGFLLKIKQEVLGMIKNGQDVQTPLCDWALKLLGDAWVYGTPTSLTQLDSMLGLLANEPGSLGHVRSRQLSFGRGCGEALFLPLQSLKLRNNRLQQTIEPSDFRFISLEKEIETYDSARARLHPVFADKFLTVLAQRNAHAAAELGCAASFGVSTLGQVAVKPSIKERKPLTKAIKVNV